MKKNRLHATIILLIICSHLLVSCQLSKNRTATPDYKNDRKPSAEHAPIDYEDSDWKNADLSGHVKSVQETTTIVYNGEKPKVSIATSDFNKYGKFLISDYQGHVFQYKYNAEGQIIERREYMSGNPLSKDIYTYSIDGVLLNKRRYEGKVFSSEEEWETHKANIPNLPHEGLFMRTDRLMEDNGNERVTVYKDDGQIDYTIAEIKDEKSRIVEFKTVYPYSDAFGYKNTWEYDGSDNLVKFKKYKGPENNLEWIFEYKYDSDNRITQETSLHYMPKSASKINENGHLEDQTKGYFLDKEASIVKSYLYDTTGNLIELTVKNYSGKLIRKEIFEITFDERGNEIHYAVKNPDGEAIEEVSRKFDRDDNLLERIIHNQNGDISLIETFTYNSDYKVIKQIIEEPEKERLEIETRSYDEYGNWIKSESIVLDSKNNDTLHTISKERAITYY
ncbi:hypothetical protein [Anditalea andensis]|uniref:Sugar-binding protein n=1 Tax=Anditalea andensis TaxID=1048983 RepID=A0A074KWY3_9BACT|nr:hypothetical protein [Anditalea andensis]KEO72720.1 hypothetical protein EL17_18485 [Anditalea andensis]